MSDPQSHEKEVWALLRSSRLAIGWLILASLVSMTICTGLIAGMIEMSDVLARILVCIAAGGLGGSVSGIRSVVERRANGWEFEDGSSEPKDGDAAKKERYGRRMAPFFWTRPLLGAALGFLAYTGVVGGFLIASTDAGNMGFSLPGMAFLSSLAGLFAKTFFVKLAEVLNAVYRT